MGEHIAEFRGEKFHFIGSCAVRDLCGKEMLDFAIVTDLIPDVPDSVIDKMASKGWVYCGASPHSIMGALTAPTDPGGKNIDQWFMKKKVTPIHTCIECCSSEACVALAGW